MNTRTAARRGLVLTAVAAAGLIALTGCKIGGGKDATGTPAAQSSASAQPSTSASGKPSARPSGKPSGKPANNTNALPDVCTLLSRAEVSALAGGKQVVQVDEDDAKPTDTTRFCQWQLSGARLAVFLSPTTGSEFSQAHTNSRPVSGLGDGAYFSSGHLYVRQGTIVIDVYASNGSDDASEKMAKSTAAKLLPRL